MKYLLQILILLLTFSSCIKNNPTPTWLEIQPWELKPNGTGNEGQWESISSNFTDAYVIIDNKIIGFFELPVKLPILQTGDLKIEIYPAIRNNGISATKKVYPFCNSHKVSKLFSPGNEISISPITTYYTEANFWIEDFEVASSKLQTATDYPANVLSLSSDKSVVKYGNQCAKIHLTQKDSIWVGKTLSNLNLPKGKDVYLEMDYKNDLNILTGVLSYSSLNGFKSNPNIQLNSQPFAQMLWKKIYIELKEIVSYSVNATLFETYFRIELPESKSEGIVYIDNLKIVY
jgi:hypothetical protein